MGQTCLAIVVHYVSHHVKNCKHMFANMFLNADMVLIYRCDWIDAELTCLERNVCTIVSIRIK